MIAFDLPINDIIPLNMARSNFLLLPDNEEIDDSMVPSETAINAQAALKGSWVEFSVSLPNSPLQLIYRVSAFNLAIDLLRNNIWLLAVNLLLLTLSMVGIYFLRQQYIRPAKISPPSWISNAHSTRKLSPACLAGYWSMTLPIIA